VTTTPFVVDAAGRVAAGTHFVLIAVDPLAIAFRTGGGAELDAGIPGFKEFVLQLQNEVTKFLLRTQERVARRDEKRCTEPFR
jgi:hypothetical protein